MGAWDRKAYHAGGTMGTVIQQMKRKRVGGCQGLRTASGPYGHTRPII